MGGDGPCYHPCNGSFSYHAKGQGDPTAGPYEADGNGHVGSGLSWASASAGASVLPAEASGAQSSMGGGAYMASAEANSQASSAFMYILGAPGTVFAYDTAYAYCSPSVEPEGNEAGNETSPPEESGSVAESECEVNSDNALTLQLTEIKLFGTISKNVVTVAPDTSSLVPPATTTTWYFSGTNPATSTSLNALWVDQTPRFSCVLSDYELFTGSIPEGATYISDLSLEITVVPGLASVAIIEAHTV